MKTMKIVLPPRLRWQYYADIQALHSLHSYTARRGIFIPIISGDYNFLATATALNHRPPSSLSYILSLLSEKPLPQEFNKPRATEERVQVLRILPAAFLAVREMIIVSVSGCCIASRVV